MRGDRTIQQIAAQREVQPNLVSACKKRVSEGVGELFASRSGSGEREAEARTLHSQIGELVVERDFCCAGSSGWSQEPDIIDIHEKDPCSRPVTNEAKASRSTSSSLSSSSVGIQIVSCDSAHIGLDTGRIRFSRTFVGEPGSTASLRHLAHCQGGTSGIDAEACLARIIAFRQEPPSGPV